MQNEKLFCLKCGAELTDENSHRAENQNEIGAYCVDCEAASFENLAALNGLHYGLFLNCARFDIPCVPSIVPADFGDTPDKKKTTDKWKDYLAAVLAHDDFKEGGKPFVFDSGEGCFFRIFGKKMTRSDFAEYCLTERALVERLPGTPAQREQWGTADLWQKTPMTTEIYNDLDRRYKKRRASYVGQTLTEQMDETLLKACRLDAIIEFLLQNGDVKAAKEAQTMLDNMLASEQMRKKDEKPVERFSMSGWQEAFEKFGFMKENDFVPKEEMMERHAALLTRPNKYPQPLDAAHQLELNVVNNARKNADQPMLNTLPCWMEITDEYGEFQKETSSEYRAALKYTGLTEVKFPKQNKKAKRSGDT